MKIALILDADSPSFLQQAQEINRFLQQSQLAATEVALWLFHQNVQPDDLPQFDCPVTQIQWLKSPELLLADSVLPLLEQVYSIYPAELLLFSGCSLGNELATRLAFRLNGASCLGVIRGQMNSGGCQVEKSVYGNNMLATLTLQVAPCCLAVARQGGGAALTQDYQSIEQQLILTEAEMPSWLIEHQVSIPEEQPLLNRAERVLAIGQGAGNSQNVQRLNEIAQVLGAQLGVSRPVAMNAWSSMSTMLGMSGALVAPEVCITAGVSGAAAFSVGIRHSKFIVAINTDPDAAIFSQADVGIVDDMNAVLEALVACVQQSNIRGIL
ncbi:electron transfer flavoprotein subunit alpha/FixB family protein [Budviciaceae bacterium CWB-B4]|uniref:Electron transfer flavoprotein subunit alpha/FixB family protein n=1 Tax=Limnobaculum xujianqingii TaxID=2738837 RepID=A0A9D7FQV0_9GAMM|nr:electron transfer flavoprotein subunit alpha/FixB family protein [Limnobaculum xujianqingii]MBK5071863.1 electron transfer flavoprotein subunit alpha/FixB family protein [Limnobaculum xujianqingii]MBK5175172.1 electron transfer flavoprotein subunit alpha/FixB family protein [Limnobaculum xujianqingii]